MIPMLLLLMIMVIKGAWESTSAGDGAGSARLTNRRELITVKFAKGKDDKKRSSRSPDPFL